MINTYLKSNGFLFFTLLSIFIFAMAMQSQLLISNDVAWLVEASRRLLEGGTYSNDFFENNPPLILYLYLPAVLIKQLTHLPLVIILRGYVFVLSALSLLLSLRFIKQLFSGTDVFLMRVFLIALTITLLILPSCDFGQREHLLVIFSMPYLLLVAYRLQGNTVHSYTAFFVGLFAALGFALKPYFLFSLVGVEFYYLFCRRNGFAWLRPEIIAICSALIAYIALVFIRHSDYLFIVIPYGLKWGYSSKIPIEILIRQGILILCLLACFAGWTTSKTNPLYFLLRVFAVAGFGFALSFLIQQTSFSYHVLPSLSLSVLIFVLLFTTYISKPLITRREQLKILLIALLAAPLVWSLYTQIEKIILVLYPAVYFEFFTFLLLLILCLTYQTMSAFLIRLLTVPCIIATGYFFSYMCQRTSLQAYTFEATTFLLIISTILVTPKIRNNKLNSVFVVLLGVLFFTLPFYNSALNYFYASRQTVTFKNFAHFLRDEAKNHSVANLSTEIFFQYVIDTQTRYVSRYSFLWMIRGLAQPSPANSQELLNHDQNFIIDGVVNDLNEKKPDYVLVDVSKRKAIFENYDSKRMTITLIPFNFLAFFLRSPHFQQAWQAYTYVQSIEDEQFGSSHIFQVYKRKK